MGEFAGVVQAEVFAQRAVCFDAERRDRDESGVLAGMECDMHVVIGLTPVERRSRR